MVLVISACALLCLARHALVSPAAAATVSVSEEALLYVGAPDEPNVLQMDQSTRGIEVYDDGASLEAGSSCALVEAHHAVCFGAISAVSVSLGDRNDDADLTGLTVPTDVSAGAGADLIQGGAGTNSLEGGSGLDTLVGRSAADTLAGGDDDDLLEAAGGADLANGELGADVLFGGRGSDTLTGGSGNDLVNAGLGDDQLEGNGGADALIGGGGRDQIRGGTGADQAFAADGEADVIDCGIGDDSAKDDGGDRSSGCAGNGAMLDRPAFWPPQARTSRALQPLPDPSISVKPRRRGSATWIRVVIHDDYSYPARVRIRLTNRRRTRHWTRCVNARSKNPYPVRKPRPPRWAYRGKGRFCH
jgi:hypothetical protein